MAIEIITEFVARATVRIIAYIKDDDGELVDPTASIKTSIWDKDGVLKAGCISVSASTSFTTGLTVTGATSGATGYVKSKPDGTTLELQQVTGVWQSGETIEDTGSGTSTTTSLLLGADMTAMGDPDNGSFTGIYEYYYHTTADSVKGWWRGEVVTIDGSAPNDKTSIQTCGFRVK